MKTLNWKEIGAITDFAYFHDFYQALDTLEMLAADENWKYADMNGRRNQNNPILENYIHHTFKRLRDEYMLADDAERPSNDDRLFNRQRHR